MLCTWYEAVTQRSRAIQDGYQHPHLCCLLLSMLLHSFFMKDHPAKKAAMEAKRKWNMLKKVMVLARKLKFGMSLSVECCVWL